MDEKLSIAEKLVLKRALDNEISLARKYAKETPTGAEAEGVIKSMGKVKYSFALDKYADMLEEIKRKLLK
jgi:3-dehydroquinate dehydratase